MLEANKNIQKILISSPCRFVGNYEATAFRIDLMFEFSADLSTALMPNPHSRNYFVVTLNTEPQTSQAGMIVPDYTCWGNIFCSLFAVFFGKRFDNCGPIQNMGIYNLPNLHQEPLRYFGMNFNNRKPRVDLNVPLNFEQLSKIFELLSDENKDKSQTNLFFQASRFYLRALQSIEMSVDMAYLDLITCGEILSNYRDYSETELYGHDKQLTAFLSKLTIDKDKNFVKKRLYQVKRKFFLSIKELLGDGFFTASEVTPLYQKGTFNFTRDNIDEAIKSAYDLRSEFVHNGAKFSSALLPFSQIYNETSLGQPYGCDEYLAKSFKKAASFTGLERIMRYCLLRFIHTQVMPIDDRLN